MTSDPRDDMPDWAVEIVRYINLTLPYAHVQGEIACALVAAERRGIERAEEVADLVACDAGDRAARGFSTGEERARRQAGKEIAGAIRQLGASE